ncbi:MAG: leucine-rich repeat domain-containing protein [Thermoguttaceae bacterium]|nr:leucine-rich repeat domain-containing protein [Thermoguttaceae bacterium]
MSINRNRCSWLIALCGLCLITSLAWGDDRSITPQKSNDGAKYSKDGTMLLSCPKDVKSFTIPSSVTKIGRMAFSGCGSLASITIPSSVTEIRGGAFIDCGALESITIPSSVTRIGLKAFGGCPELTVIADRGSIAWKYAELFKIPVQELDEQ